MPRIVKSPVERWSGTVTLYEPLDIEQVIAIEDAQDELEEYLRQKGKPAEDGSVEVKWTSRQDRFVIPAISKCIEKWDIEGVKPDPFPASPRNDAHTLTLTLWFELIKIYKGEKEVPNE